MNLNELMRKYDVHHVFGKFRIQFHGQMNLPTFPGNIEGYKSLAILEAENLEKDFLEMLAEFKHDIKSLKSLE